MPRHVRLFALLALFVTVVASLARADEPIAPDKEKAAAADPAAEATIKKAEPPTEVTDAAKPVLEKMKAAYGKLTGLQLAGTWSAQWDVNGDTGKEAAEFTSSYSAPNRFRHETKDDLLFGSTGEKVYAFKQNQFLMSDAPKSRGGLADLPQSYSSLLKEKNPSLLLAVTDDETPFLAEKATKIDKADDVTLDGKTFTALKVSTGQDATVSVLIDPATNLMRQWSVDMKAALEKRGQQNVNRAVMTIDYKTITPEAPAAKDAFAWAPPEGARDAAKRAVDIDEDEQAVRKKLVGKDAPDFTLKDIDGKEIKLKDANKDHVLVLDFWATWCGPCRASLPVLQKVTEARKDKKLKVFAINCEEDKDTIAAFVKETKLALRVLLDSNGDAGKAYLSDDGGIPETVIIGKDGKVKQVLLGIHDEKDLEKEIDEALK